jgi:predicted dehydrogenase
VPVADSWETDVHGTEGMVRIRTGQELEIVDRRGVHREPAGPDRRFEQEIEAFLEAIAGSPAVVPRGEDGRETLAVALAIAESEATGRVVVLRPERTSL